MKTDLQLRVAALCVAAALSAPCLAQHPTTANASEGLTERLRTLYPGTRFGTIQTTSWPGVFEVALGNQLAYVDASGQYFLFGHLYDMKAQRDITAVLKQPEVRAKLRDLGAETVGSTAEAFAARVKAESAMWEKVIRTAKIGTDH